MSPLVPLVMETDLGRDPDDLFALLYLIGAGALDWGPIHRARRQSPLVSPERTTQTTVRRVGLEGRGDGPDDGREVAA